MKHSNNVKESYSKNSFSKNIAVLIKNISRNILDNISVKKYLLSLLSRAPFNKASFKIIKPSVLTSVLTSILVSLLFVVFFTVFCLAFTGCDSISNLTGNLGKLQSLESNTAQNKNAEDTQQSKNTEIIEDKNSDISAEDTSSAKTEDNEEAANTSETQSEIQVGNTDEANPPKEIAIDPALQTINVYYANNTGEYLVGEARDVEGSSKLVDAIYEMMKEPIDPNLVVLIPSTTKINSVKAYENGIAKIDLSQSFIDDRFQSDTVDILLVYSIVNTLTEFKEIQAVEFYIDGKKLDILGQLDIKGPIYRRSDLIKQ